MTIWNERPWIKYIATELLDFLMTEDDNYLITDDSVFNTFNWRTLQNTNWNGRPLQNTNWIARTPIS